MVDDGSRRSLKEKQGTQRVKGRRVSERAETLKICRDEPKMMMTERCERMTE